MTATKQYVEISGAAKILGLGETRARSLLFPPDQITYTVNGKERFLYCCKRVENVARMRECEKCQRSANKGKRPCYLCRVKCTPADLTSGICADCRAMKIMRNFVCHGDCLFNKPDESRIDILFSALDRLKNQISSAGKINET